MYLSLNLIQIERSCFQEATFLYTPFSVLRFYSLPQRSNHIPRTISYSITMMIPPVRMNKRSGMTSPSRVPTIPMTLPTTPSQPRGRGTALLETNSILYARWPKTRNANPIVTPKFDTRMILWAEVSRARAHKIKNYDRESILT